MKRTPRLLVCDDSAINRNDFMGNVPTFWFQLYTESIIISQCEDISITVDRPNVFDIDRIGEFDAIILDVIWIINGEEIPHGIDICKLIRARYPEMPIILYSAKVSVPHFIELIPHGISGFLSKLETNTLAWCIQINDAIESNYRTNGNYHLLKLIRQLSQNDSSPLSDAVHNAATEVWQQGNPYDKWECFWTSFDGLVANKRLNLPFGEMRKLFTNSDLFVLGASPSMKGHLEHVLNVYFTGYVVSHLVFGFKETVVQAAKNMLGKLYTPDKDELYWDLFQFSWLTAASLHDVAYSIEALPDAIKKINSILGLYTFIKPKPSVKQISEWTFNTMIQIESAKLGYRKCFSAFYNNADSNWIIENLIFTENGISRVNHGVASSIQFSILSEAWAKLPGQPAELPFFLNWASTAIALHSLKIPGSKSSVIDIEYKNDPLSFLLLLCDEVQIWNRERPDNNALSNNIRASCLTDLAIDGTNIEASITLYPYKGKDITAFYSYLEGQINNTTLLLSKYLKASPLNIKLNFNIHNNNRQFPQIVLV